MEKHNRYAFSIPVLSKTPSSQKCVPIHHWCSNVVILKAIGLNLYYIYDNYVTSDTDLGRSFLPYL